MSTVKMPVALIMIFLWIGFVCAISFMEAWLKFRAPGISIPLGLGIGRLVFAALNKVEWVFATVILLNIIVSKYPFFSLHNILYFIPLILLIIQTLWVLPKLDARAELLIQGQNVSASNLHYYYVGMELVKVVCLSIFGIKLFKYVEI